MDPYRQLATMMMTQAIRDYYYLTRSSKKHSKRKEVLGWIKRGYTFILFSWELGYNPEELREILITKLKENDYISTDPYKKRNQ